MRRLSPPFDVDSDPCSREAPPSLLIVGASARAAACSARRAGWAPHAADLFGDADLQAVAPTRVVPWRLEPLVEFLQEHAGLPWLYTGGLENHPDWIATLAGISPLWGVASSGLAAVRNLDSLAAILAPTGCELPERRNASEGLPADGSWLWKGTRSAGGLHVHRWRGTRESHAPDGYWQRFEPGEPLGGTFLMAGGSSRLLGVTRSLVGRFPGEESFVYGGSIGPLPLCTDQRARWERLGAALAKSEGLVGLIGVDVVERDKTLRVLEVNPRYPAGVEVLERAGGFSAVGLHIAACRAGKLPDVWEPGCLQPHETVSKRIHYARREQSIGRVPFARLLAWHAECSPPPITDLPAIGTRLRPGDPIATTWTMGSESERVRCDQQQVERLAGILASDSLETRTVDISRVQETMA